MRGFLCNVKEGRLEEKERNCGSGFCIFVCERMQDGEGERVGDCIYRSIYPLPSTIHQSVNPSIYSPIHPSVYPSICLLIYLSRGMFQSLA